jgi:hypothetical protein
VRSYLKEKVADWSRKQRIWPQGIRADQATPFYTQKLSLTGQTSGGRSVGIVRSSTKATELVFIINGID